MKLRAPSHATVIAYLALFVAIGGSAYAVSKIGSAQIENRSIKGKDVADGALTGRQIDESRLTGPATVGSATSIPCNPTASDPVDCVGTTIRLHADSSLLVIATGRSSGNGSGFCGPVVDGGSSDSQTLDETARTLAITKLTPPLGRGKHSVVLACNETSADLEVSDLTIAAVAVDNALLGP